MPPSTHSTSEVWRHYAVTGSLPESVLRAPVFRAWQRCDRAGASPFVMRAYELPPAQARSVFEQERDLIQAAAPYMRALSQAAGPERHAAMLGDSNATVLDVVGDEESVHGRQRVPGPGALLSEARAGANGIGSPLAEKGYIELVGPEHFIEGFHPFTCQGLPLYGPEGETVGVLSTSVRRVEASLRIREILICAARGIEAELMRRRLSADLQKLLESHGEAPVLEELEQDIVQLQGAARLRLEKAVRLARSDRQSEALRLVEAATGLIERFRLQSRLWRDIASSQTGSPRFLDLGQLVGSIAALLATEAAVRGIEVEILPSGSPVHVFADPWSLRRALFRIFLRAFDTTAPGKTLRVEVAMDERYDLGVVRIPSAPEAFVAVPRQREAGTGRIKGIPAPDGQA